MPYSKMGGIVHGAPCFTWTLVQALSDMVYENWMPSTLEL